MWAGLDWVQRLIGQYELYDEKSTDIHLQSNPIQWGITGAGGILFARILQSSSHTNWYTSGTG